MKLNSITPLNSRLKMYRTKQKLTQQEVADVLGVNRSTYTYYENGRSEPNLETLSKLSIIFKIDLPSLLGCEKVPDTLHDTSTHEENTSNEFNDVEDLYFNKLSKDEKNLVIKFRMLSKKQKEETLVNFGLSNSSTQKKSNNE